MGALGDIWNGFVFALQEVLKFFFDLTGSAGLAIVIFTIATKVVLLPLTLSQLRTMRVQQQIQPRLRELQKKYKDNREKLNQEMMNLYKEYGINPTAGCLPSLLQLPIFFGIYYAVLNLSRPLSLATMLGRWAGMLGLGNTLLPIPDLRTGFPSPGILANEPFLWMPTLGIADPLHILPILAAGLQFIQQRMMTPRDSDPQQSAMNNAMMFMPLMLLFLGWNWPAGPVLYWVTQSLLGIVQQYFVSGWGSLSKWLPFLPERKPREISKPKQAKPEVTAAAAEQPRQQPRGLFWRLMDRMSAMQEQMAQQEGVDGGKEEAATEAEGEPALPPPPSKRRSRR